jgi:ribosomal protein S18 acetylase RimI-like enzyme
VTLELREATEADLDYIVEIETAPDAVSFLARWTRERHLEAFATEDEEHLIIVEDGEPAGYALLSGIETSTTASRCGAWSSPARARGWDGGRWRWSSTAPSSAIARTASGLT